MLARKPSVRYSFAEGVGECGNGEIKKKSQWKVSVTFSFETGVRGRASGHVRDTLCSPAEDEETLGHGAFQSQNNCQCQSQSPLVPAHQGPRLNAII